MKDLNVRWETIKLLERNTGKTLPAINHNKIFYDPPPRVMEIKANINKWDLIKLKSFCTTKKAISNVKRRPSEWEKIIANEATDKQLISRIYKQLLQLTSMHFFNWEVWYYNFLLVSLSQYSFFDCMPAFYLPSLSSSH